MASLPKTFQEAVAVTRTLGIHYLWIDSLCIMQDKDDLSDWYKEATMMDKVYMHSICNISATDAQDSSRGLFRDRKPHHLKEARATLCVDGLGYHEEGIDCKIVDVDLQENNISASAVGQRGWILQERVLAPRVLHFASHQLFWECSELEACERYPLGLPEHTSKSNFKANHNYGSRKPMEPVVLGTKTVEPFSDRDTWTELVETYSSMLLTCPGDKVIALSGIAKQRALREHDIYIAGMWRRDLSYQLLWYVSASVYGTKDDIKPPPTTYRAPSWSWASIDRPVQFHARSVYDEFLFHIDDVHVTHATEDVTGAVTSAWLELRVQLKPAYLHAPARSNDIDMDAQHPTTMEEVSKLRIEEIMLDNPHSDVTAVSEGEDDQRLFYIPAGKIRQDLAPNSINFLILRVVDKASGTFERIGYAVYLGVKEGVEALLADLGEDEKESLPCVRYKDGLHTIRII
jgi:hypothetical protein